MVKEKEIIRAIKELVRKLFPEGEGKVFLFGSRAKGYAKKHSDWDLLILLDDDIEVKDNYERYAFPFAELGWKFNEQITPIHYSKSEWEQESDTAFYKNVSKSLIAL